MRKPRENTVPIIATAKWEPESKRPTPPTRVIESVRVPTKRYGIDYVQLDEEAEKLARANIELKLQTVKTQNCKPYPLRNSVVILSNRVC